MALMFKDSFFNVLFWWVLNQLCKDKLKNEELMFIIIKMSKPKVVYLNLMISFNYIFMIGNISIM